MSRLVVPVTGQILWATGDVRWSQSMTWLSELLQGIPVNAVLRERLALVGQKFKDMEAENEKLKGRVAALTEENEALKKRVEQAPVAAVPEKETPGILYGAYYFGGDTSKLYCPRCYERGGEEAPHGEDGDHGTQMHGAPILSTQLPVVTSYDSCLESGRYRT